MDDHDWLAQRFEDNRVHLLAVAFRILGSRSDAEDAVQEAWVAALSHSDTSDIENLRGWLTTVVARLSLNRMLAETRAHRLREMREEQGLTQDELAARMHVTQPSCPPSSAAS